MKYYKDGIHMGGHALQLVGQPAPFGSGGFVLRTVQVQHKNVRGPRAVVPALFPFREAGEIVGEKRSRNGLEFNLHGREFWPMRAYIVITAEPGRSQDIAHSVAALDGVKMADACWGVGDVYSVCEFPNWADLSSLVLDKVHSMPGVIRTETHVAVES